MKKSTKKTMTALIIILIFGFSSIAFVASSVFYGGGNSGSGGQSQEFMPLDNFVIEGEIDSFTQDVYVQNGFTFLKVYHTGDEDISFVDSLPQLMTTPTGETQLIVQKIPSSVASASIINLQAFETLEEEEITQEAMFTALCKNLVFTPTDCLLLNITNEQELPVQSTPTGHGG